ncbi:hypothetical protein ACFQX6_18775 [Streptosporangium lutulentum]
MTRTTRWPLVPLILAVARSRFAASAWRPAARSRWASAQLLSAPAMPRSCAPASSMALPALILHVSSSPSTAAVIASQARC